MTKEMINKLKVIHRGMLARCYNKNNRVFKYVGAKGIKVCNEWKNDFKSFEKWALEKGYADGLILNRIKSDKDFDPTNCRFTTRTISNRCNSKIRKKNNSGYRGVGFHSTSKKWRARIKLNGKSKTLGYSRCRLQCAYMYDNYVNNNNLEHTTKLLKFLSCSFTGTGI